MQIDEAIVKKYGNKVRIRVCGILIENDEVLLVRHEMGKDNYLWTPPGGGLEYKETLEECLKREFLEESNLVILILEFIGIFEFIEPPLHSVELYFTVQREKGQVKLGSDPEFTKDAQIIREVKFMSLQTIKALNPAAVHHLFIGINKLSEIISRKSIFI